MHDAHDVQKELEKLILEVTREGQRTADLWLSDCPRETFRSGAENLAMYLALRRRDLRFLQRRLMPLGLSSLGRLEGRVLPALNAVHAALSNITGEESTCPPFLTEDEFFAGELRLRQNTEEVFGTGDEISLMITAPMEAAQSPAFAKQLLDRGVQSLRINCAHDNEATWLRMINQVRQAEVETGHRLRVFMDLGGPKIRTANGRLGEDLAEPTKLHVDDIFIILKPGSSGSQAVPSHAAVTSCTLEAPVDAADVGHRVFYDDGKVCAVVERRESWGLVTRVTQAPANGAKLKDEKGLNFPDTDFPVEALTEKDKQDLRFIARHADGVGFSFVQSADDVDALEEHLKICPREMDQPLCLILKIETTASVQALPDLLAAAASRRPTAVMVARGDLAVESGFDRTAEMQEEILWICEAAHIPVIWATQVLENFIKKRKHSRGEMTDAAMSSRAECVMLNKGPYLMPAIDILRHLLPRMGEHLHKKTPQLRRLATWSK
jgi:pyruvate kinase